MDVIAPVGASIQLQCKNDRGTCRDMYWGMVGHNGDVKIIYLHTNGSRELNDERYKVKSADGVCVLRIDDIHYSDAGTYTCGEGVAGVSNQSRKTATVTVTGI